VRLPFYRRKTDMKKINIIPVIVTIVLLFAGVAKPSDAQQKTRTFSVNKNGKLIVDVNPGTIKIKTTTKDEVIVTVKDLDEELLKSVEINADKNVVEVKYDEGMDDPEFIITVPVKFNLVMKTAAGDIKLEDDIDGNVDASTSGGDISVEAVKGYLSVESSGGDIRLLGTVGGNLKVNTMGGDISVANVLGKNAKVNTMGGEITINKASGGISVKTYGGDITVGDIGGDSDFITYGGNVSIENASGNVKMETYGGNLTLVKANGKAKGKTNGGNIDVQNISGSVDLRTLAGEVSVGLNPASGSESVITTNAGSIELRVPSTAKVTIVARIHVQGWWREAKENYKIQSDFESTTYNIEEDNHDIVGVYQLNGGGSKIQLKAVNDEIRIIKETK
jgi:DUF4097 and DUF4098 domain-containing protein YvlB